MSQTPAKRRSKAKKGHPPCSLFQAHGERQQEGRSRRSPTTSVLRLVPRFSLGGPEKPKMLLGFGMWGTSPPGSLGLSPASFMPRNEWTQCPSQPGGGCLSTALWETSSFSVTAFPSQLSPPAPLLPATEVLPAHSPALTKAGLSGAEQGRPTGRARAPHHSPSLRKRTGPVQ